MNERIFHPTNSGGVAILIPCDCGLSVQEIARKDVPAGVPYIIGSISDIPADRTYRAAWTADFSQPDGYGIGAEAWFAEQEQRNANHSN
jgi:hypothetical protein